MVCGDEENVAVLQSGFIDSANCSVGSCDGFDGGLEYTGVTNLSFP